MNREKHINLIEPLLEESLSLTVSEKEEIRASYEKLTGFQFDQLIKIFIEEKKIFEELANQFPKDVQNLKKAWKDETLEEDVKSKYYIEFHSRIERVKDFIYKKNDFAGVTVSFDKYNLKSGINFSDIVNINLKLDNITRNLFSDQNYEIRNIKIGSIEETFTGNISQIITICSILFAASKGILHLLKEGVEIKKITTENEINKIESKKREYETEIKKIELIEKKEEIKNNNLKKENLRKLLLTPNSSLPTLIDKLDPNFIEFLLENFEFNPFESIDYDNIEKSLNAAESLNFEYPIKEIIIGLNKNTAQK